MPDTARLDSTAVTPVVPQGFEARQKVLAGLLKTIEEKKYDEAIAQADKVVMEATSNKDTVNLRDAYRILSKAYHGKEDFKQRDVCEQRIQSLAVAYGYHLDEGLDFLAKKEIHADILPWILMSFNSWRIRGDIKFEEIKLQPFKASSPTTLPFRQAMHCIK
ncbi:MAG: hypothetical protein IPP25_09425 [Saprospiraceae bacterium]|nr:hypothetical protein [Candidatus Opimibacter skivensis]